MLALADPRVAEAVRQQRARMASEVEAKDAALQERLGSGR
jgi:5-(carboxyamino)imidazole ribonucleotide mutase